MKKRNFFIYFTAFFCGMSVMAIELSATRLLAPYFGTSMIIWTVVIGLIMVSLSLGNVLGGRAADKYNSSGWLFNYIWIASIWITIIPIIGKYVIALTVIVLMWILPAKLLVAGSVLSCLLIFSFPLVILGMASPYLVKLGVKDIDNNGRTTGEIYALSTIGSIIGTFIPTFLTIPVIGTSKTFFVFALVLNLICLYYSIKTKSRIVRTSISAILIVGLMFAPFDYSYAFWKKNVLEDESLYNYLQVADEGDTVVLSTNVAFGFQSVYKKDQTISGYYYDYALMAPFFLKNTDFKKNINALILGFGTGTFAKECKYFFPNSKIEGVEIDKKIIDLSKKYFGLTDNDAKVYINDGRTFLNDKNAGKYDIIMVDAYHDITIPFHMSTKEFFAQVKEHLNKNGIIIININMRSEKNSQLPDYLTHTLKSEMQKVYKINLQNTTNSLVISSDDVDCGKYFLANIGNLSPDNPLYGIAQYVKNNMEEVSQSKYVLTDEIAPVEILGQKLLDEIIGDYIDDIKQEIGASQKSIWNIFNIISQ